jgi:hypothetical protein
LYGRGACEKAKVTARGRLAVGYSWN